MDATANTSGAAAATAPSSQASYSCAACQTSFDSNELRREHMREDWHVYNLKRRVAALPPVSLVLFQTKVDSLDQEDDGSETHRSLIFHKSCASCQRSYTNSKRWQTHLRSREHIQTMKSEVSKLSESPNASEASDGPDTSDDESSLELQTEALESLNKELAFVAMQCLFCNITSATMDDNLAHMSQAHSFFIPDTEYLLDMETFLRYLSTLISEFHECLFCGSLKNTKVAIQGHMRDKGHCKLDFENEDNQLHEFYEASGDEEDELGTDEQLIRDEEGLHLPSKKVLGHRSRAWFFRQNHSNKSAESDSKSNALSFSRAPSVRETSDTERIPTTSNSRTLVMRAGTSTSIVGLSDQQQRALRAVEKKIVQTETRVANEYQNVLDKGGNKQKRFKVRSIGKKQGGLEKRLG